MSQVTVTLPDGSTRSVPTDTPVGAVAESISPRLAKAALAATVGDCIVDLSHRLKSNTSVRFLTAKDGPEALRLYRHSTAHLLAAAVTSLFPEAQCGIGPPTEDGFFYDFVVNRPFVPEDLEAIETKMRELASRNLAYERKIMNKSEAKKYFADRGEPLKVELVEEKGGPEVSCYTIDDVFMDFCTGPHVPTSGALKAFRVLNSSNAYWKGDANNQPMQRIYGTAFFTEKDLKVYLTRLEEAKKRDHRKLGRELSLFTFHPWAPGATFWLAAGTTLWNQLADYMRALLFPEGYVELRTPLVYNKQLWETSGHWEHYNENMLLVESEGEAYSLKPMNCPGHMLVFASEVRSYRDLPIRYHDQSVLHRNEASGVLAGLTRARQFCQDDAHCFVTREQIADEVELLLKLVQKVYSDFQLQFSVELSTRPETFLGNADTWDQAEAQLKQALDGADQEYRIAEGEGNFYGPKIDFHVVDAIGRNWQCATIQLDYQLPERFQLKYIGEDNAEHRPVVIHRAIFGSFERFIALLIEHYAGAFPLWLAPIQAIVVPIADRHGEYAKSVATRLQDAGLRVEVDARQEKMGYKIRSAQLRKVPYMLVTGDREAADEAVAVRHRTDGDRGASSLDEFIEDALDEVNRRL
ncbi:MAG: threonine--tRNA ligase [Acidobacteria bacterium]|nr:threonine--tRNA ligase [Acidobacteriota bacterium]